MRFKGFLMDIYFRFIAQAKECLQTSTMIVVTMRDDCHIHVSDAHAKPLGILSEEGALPHIEQNMLASTFYVKAQAMLNGKSSLTRILYE